MLKMRQIILILLLSLGMFLTSCKKDRDPSNLPTPVLTSSEYTAETMLTPQAIIPTEIIPEIPLAAMVNGEGILLEDYERELALYKASFADEDPMPNDEDIKQIVIDFLIEQQLLVCAAHKNGYTLSDQALNDKFEQLSKEIGGAEAMNAWMQNNHYHSESLLRSLSLASTAAYQRDLIIAQIPEAVEQVRAQQIFSTSKETINGAEQSLIGGSDFNKLAWDHNPKTGGELGWFPRDYLVFPEIEEVAFSLPVGSRSEIIQTDLGYHIIFIIAHEDAHPLSTDARVALQSKALNEWLSKAREEAVIELFIP